MLIQFPAQSLKLEWNGHKLKDGDTFLLENIGESVSGTSERGLSLVCFTQDVNNECCRERNTLAGEWIYPDGSIVPHLGEAPESELTRSGYLYEIRLNRHPGRSTGTSPYGLYTCLVPSWDEEGKRNYTISVNLRKL